LSRRAVGLGRYPFKLTKIAVQILVSCLILPEIRFPLCGIMH